MANFTDYTITNTNDAYSQYDGGSSTTGIFALGYDNGLGLFSSGAVRFRNVQFSQNANVNEAILSIRVDVRRGTSPVKGRIYGIDEDNTADFTSSPGSRSRTTATKDGQYDPSGTGWWRENVTDIVNEIFARGGWSGGNALGFYIEDNGTSTGGWNEINDVYLSSGQNSILSIRQSSLPDFTPGPYSVSAKNPPTQQQFGILVSTDGRDAVVTSQKQHQSLTSNARVAKIAVKRQEGWPTTANLQSFSHGLKYPPTFLSYFRAAGKSFYGSYNPSALSSDPSGGVAAYTWSDHERISMSLDANGTKPSEWFYYVFIDDNL